ncbi:hypothetical protein GGI21_005395, partial [Coemansia aciculifera]
MIDPVEILKTRDLLDPLQQQQALPKGILQQMWALVSGQPIDHLAPNLGLLLQKQEDDGLVPKALVSVARRYGLQLAGGELLSQLRASFVDSGMKIRTRQFWATLEADSIGDFALLAHLVIATHEASLTQTTADDSIEATCYAAARQEWESGRVEPTTGAVFALLLLSEYGYQTGRSAVMSEFADHALRTAQLIRFRETAYPWTAGGPINDGSCDVEREHVLACFWSAWVRAFTAAQVLGRPAPLSPELPDFPTHDMCHYTAQPVAGAQPGSVAFPPSNDCRHVASGSYSRATWQCALMGAEMHNLGVEVKAGQRSSQSYFAALRSWDRRLCRWRAEWPAEWSVQMSRVARLAQNLRNKEPLAVDAEWLADLDLGLGSPTAIQPSPVLPPSPDTRPVGSHLFHESRLTAADSWLSVVFVMHDMTRLRAHRVALDLLGESSTGDPLSLAITEHASRATTLDAVRGLQNTLGVVRRLGFPPERMG